MPLAEAGRVGEVTHVHEETDTTGHKVFYGLICGDVKIAKINTELLTLNIQAIGWAGPRTEARHSFVPEESSSASFHGKPFFRDRDTRGERRHLSNRLFLYDHR